MVDSEHLDEVPAGHIGAERKALEPCTIVIFGASGDLTARKLIPAFYHLFKDKQMPPAFRIVGFARREKTDESWRTELRAALDQFSRTKPVDDAVWQEFAQNLFYCQGDLTDAAAYQKLEEMLTSFGSAPLRENLLFYLATSPSQFGAGRRANCIGPDCCTRKAPAGSASSSRNRSATTSPPRTR